MKRKFIIALLTVIALTTGFVSVELKKSIDQKRELLEIAAQDMNIEPKSTDEDILTSVTMIHINYQDLHGKTLNLNNLHMFKNLESIYLDGLIVSNVPALENMKGLKELHISNMNLDQFDSIQLPHLKNLQILDCKFSNLYFIKQMSELEGLSITKNKDDKDSVVCDIEDLINNEKLEVIYLTNIKIANINLLSSMEQITSLGLLSCDVKDFSFLDKLNKLESLELKDDNLKNIEGIGKLYNLKYLNIENNYITDIHEVSNLKNLVEVYLGNNTITDISPLKGLEHIQTLRLNDTNVMDVSVILDLPKIQILDIRNTKVKNLDYLMNYPKRLELYLNLNNIEKVDKLKENKNLYLSEDYVG